MFGRGRLRALQSSAGGSLARAMSPVGRRVLLVLLASFLAALTATAVAATRNGVTPLAPRAGDTVPVGEPPTFKVRVSGRGVVFVRVCKSRKRGKAGLICAREAIGRAKRGKGRVFRFKPRFYDFPGYWLNEPGTYYWQAYRIRCEKPKDCRQEGPVSSVRVQ